MAIVRVHSKLLDRFTNMAAKALKTNYNGLRGFDTKNKVITVFMAREILDLDIAILSNYYRIPEHYLLDRFKVIEIGMLLDNSLAPRIETVKKRWLKILEV